MVQKEWQMESKKLIPQTINAIISAAVIPRYIFHRIEDVCFSLGRNDDEIGPGTSDSKSFLAPTPSLGSTAINSTIIPIPPSH